MRHLNISSGLFFYVHTNMVDKINILETNCLRESFLTTDI